MNNFQVTIGIEIHIELNTKSKMFSPTPNLFDVEPNTLVHPIDVAYPGTLPRINKQAIIKAIKLAKALNMEIDTLIRFDRKSYFYPDLPKGFQITQQFFPIGKKGTLKISKENGDVKVVNINRIHLEEDTAKQIHDDNFSYLDFNRAGIPLIEIVSEPDMSTAEEAALYVESIRKIALCLNISDAKMSEGSLRADINISIRPYGQKEYGSKVEIKNLNSINNIKKAIEFEVNLQIAKSLKNELILMQTKRFDEATSQTIAMRTKTGEVDYKYMPEPNIPHIKLSQEIINNVKIELLPWEMETKLKELNVDEEYISQLLNDLDLFFIFDSIKYEDKNKLARIFFNEVVAFANQQNKKLKDMNYNFDELVNILNYADQGEISGKHVKELIVAIYVENKSAHQIILDRNIKLISDPKLIETKLQELIDTNKNVVSEFNDRPEKVKKMILGSFMKETKGQANPVLAANILETLLEKK